MSESPDARSLVSASSQLNLMEIDAVRDLLSSLQLLFTSCCSLLSTVTVYFVALPIALKRVLNPGMYVVLAL